MELKHVETPYKWLYKWLVPTLYEFLKLQNECQKSHFSSHSIQLMKSIPKTIQKASHSRLIPKFHIF